MMRSANGFVWKDLETPGRYVIKTASYEYTGSASMTIRQYIKGELAAETKVSINIIDKESLGKRPGNRVPELEIEKIYDLEIDKIRSDYP